MKEKKYISNFIFIAFTIMSFHLSAQDIIITGTVKDINKKPLVFSGVNILNTSVATNTDEKGKFTLKIPQDLPLSKLVITYVGHKTDTIDIIPDKTNYEIFLSSSQSPLNEVVITDVSKTTAIINQDPTSIKIVSAKAIEETTESNIIDVLVKNVPGLNAIKTGPNVSKPFIRGLGYSRIETLYDGVPQEGQQFEDEEVLAVDMYSIEKAEVIMGPTTLIYGPDALAGIIKLIPSMPKDSDKTVHGRFFSEYQSNNGLTGNGLRVSYGNDHWSFILRGAYRIAKNYTNSIDGQVYNTGFHETNTSGTIIHKSKKGYSNLNFTLYDNSQGIPDGSRDSLTRKFTKPVYEDPDDDVKKRPIVSDAELNSYSLSPIYQHIQHYRVYSNNHYDFDNTSVNAMISFQQNVRREYDYPIHREQAGVAMRLNSLNYDFRYQGPKISNVTTSIGANGMYQTNTNIDATDFPIPNYTLFDCGLFFMAKFEVKKFTLAGGVRYDIRNVKGNNFYTKTDPVSGFDKQVQLPDTAGAELLFPHFEKTFNGISADIRATFQINEHLNIKLNIAKGSGAPQVSEFASNGLDASAHSYFIGKSNVVPENNWQEDIGTVINFKNIDISCSLFNNYLQDYIYLVKQVDANGNPIELIPGNLTYKYQQGAAQLYGVESTVDLHPKRMKGFHFINNFSLIYGLNVSSQYKNKGIEGGYLPLIPPMKLLSIISQDIKTRSKIISLISLRAEADCNAAQNRYLGLNTTETATPAYILLNAGIHFTINYTKKSALHFQFQINNILDKAYQSNLNRLKYFEYYNQSPNGHSGIYSMGRNISVKLILPF